MPDVVTFGETMGRLTTRGIGPLRHTPTLDVGVAGAESNVAIGLARLGISVQWVGRLGDDEFGHLASTTLRGEGVETRTVIDPEAQTGLLIRERRTSAVMRVTYYRDGSAGSRLCVADIDEASVRRAKVLHVSGITPALSDSAREATLHAVALAKSSGTVVSLDVNYRAQLWREDEAAQTLRPLVRSADIVFAGVTEARLVTGTDVDHARLARHLQDLGPRHVVIKRGRDGATSVVDGELRESQPYTVVEVDPVGAGDAFAAGYLAEWVNGEDPETLLDTAARCGALAATVEGDWEGQPSRHDLALLGSSDVHR